MSETHGQGPSDADQHKPLRDDVRLLGELLGATLREREGNDFFLTVEQVRAKAKAARANRKATVGELESLLSSVSVDTAMRLARAFSHFLSLANVAEQHHRIRRRRVYLRDPQAAPQRGSAEATCADLIAAGISSERVHQAVATLRIELVVTAHPTEVARRTMIHKYNRIAALLAERDRPDVTLPELDEILRALRREIAAAWESDEVRHKRLLPLDEVRAGLVVFEQSLWSAVPAFARSVDRALRGTTGKGLPLEAAPVRFGSWIGGDRDGNPFVTPSVTREACLLARYLAADLYLREIETLRDELSMTRATDELRQHVGDAREPYRHLLREVRATLEATRTWAHESRQTGHEVEPGQPIYRTAAELAWPLRLCHRSLVETGNGLIADGRLTDILRRVAAFGVTMARLDIRQESRRHAEALDCITQALGLGSYLTWEEPARVAFLTRELGNPRPLIPAHLETSVEVRDTLETFAAIARIDPESLGAYVVTMTHAASDVLAVWLLQKAAGVEQPLRVVPLFETAQDLTNAADVLDLLLRLPEHRARIGGRQEVMVGYSDSAKDVGRFSASWDLYKAQERITAVCRSHDVAVTLFHGRGGSAGRGGGPTYLALMAQPAGSIDGTLRVTEQGEMVQALFGVPDIAVRTMEIYTSGTLESWLRPAPAPKAEWRDAMERYSADARRVYCELVYDRPEFMDYWRAATPIVELESVNLGSRPARRVAPGGVRAFRAIPWQFSWMQTRLILGSWLGVEEALAGAYARGEGELLQTMHREWIQFRSTLGLMEMVLAKADPDIAATYDRELVPPTQRALGEELRARLVRATEMIRRVTGHRELLDDNPVLRRSIDVRNPYVDPINLLQIELLKRLRAGSVDPLLRSAFDITVNGVAAGLRNTG